MQSDPHQAPNIKRKQRQIRLDQHFSMTFRKYDESHCKKKYKYIAQKMQCLPYYTLSGFDFLSWKHAYIILIPLNPTFI